jgi:hypothetical protein
MKQPKFPEGWDEERVRRVLEHYESQWDEEAVAAYESTTHTTMDIPVELVPEVRELSREETQLRGAARPAAAHCFDFGLLGGRQAPAGDADGGVGGFWWALVDSNH